MQFLNIGIYISSFKLLKEKAIQKKCNLRFLNQQITKDELLTDKTNKKRIRKLHFTLYSKK